MIIDTHFHPQLIENFAEYKTKMLQKVTKSVAVAVSLQDYDYLSTLCRSEANIFFSSGIHPLYLQSVTREDYHLLASYCNAIKCVAVGETGLDFFRETSTQGQQQQVTAFQQQLLLSQKIQKPVIVHSRGAEEETLQMLKKYRTSGVLHSFTGSATAAKEALSLGYFISFSGILTFKNAAKLRRTAEDIPLERILLETDAPFLTPEPLRGQPNMPAHIIYTADQLAKIKNLSTSTIIEQTTRNAFALFKF